MKHSFKTLLSLALIFVGFLAKANIFVVSNTNDDFGGSLRAAINAANSSPGRDTIHFNIGSGHVVILPLSPLPTIADALVDGGSQPGFGGSPIIEINGVNMGTGDGLVLNNAALRSLVINGCNGSGVVIYGQQSSVENCYVGTDYTGTMVDANVDCGIRIETGSFYNEVRNCLISGNNVAGIKIFGGVNYIFGNKIGTSADGLGAIPNQSGMIVYGSYNLIGSANAQDRNIISGNNFAGIEFSASANNLIRNNLIGLKINETDSLPNSTGLYFSAGSKHNVVGGNGTGEGNIISGNSATGIDLFNSDSNNVAGNLIGLTPSGIKANLTQNIIINYSKYNIIGGGNAGDRNFIGGNTFYNINLNYADSNTVQGNTIGLDMSGANPTNSIFGIYCEYSKANLIGGVNAGEGNVISGHNQAGIRFLNSSNFNLVKGNLIGPDASGSNVISILNQMGVYCDNGVTGNIIGGVNPGEGNVISGNTIGISTNVASNNYFIGNYIGTDASGQFSIPNFNGFAIYGSHNFIGGPNPGEGNIVSGNSGTAIQINADSTIIKGNKIGTDVNGYPLPNAGNGIYIGNGHGILIGGLNPNDQNIIAYNNSKGVFVDDNNGPSNVAILSNSIYRNAQLQIDLNGDGPTQNDSLDLDAGPNGLQNFPVVGCIHSDGLNTDINFKLMSEANKTYYIDLFKDTVAGGALYHLGNMVVHTDANGNFAGVFTYSSDISSYFITATATDSATGSTSEFGPSVKAVQYNFTTYNAYCENDLNGSAAINVSGGLQPYTYTWNTGATTANINNIPYGIYTVNVQTANGCSVLDSAYVYYSYSLPSLALTATSGHVCPGYTSTVTAAGANSFLWNTGESTSTITSSINSPDTLIVTGTDLSGCSNTDSIVVYHFNSTRYMGLAEYDSSGTFYPVRAGKVYLYDASVSGNTTPADSAVINPDGTFAFPPIYPVGTYKVLASPDRVVHPQLFDTYKDLAYTWDSAYAETFNCADTLYSTILLQYVASQTGGVTIEGTVRVDGSFIGKTTIQGDPLPGVDISLEQNPGSQLRAVTQTDANGHYQFSNVPQPDPGTYYYIIANIPGYGLDSTYIVNIAADGTYSGYDYFVSDTSIYISDSLEAVVTVINQTSGNINYVSAYPNPYNDRINIEYELAENAQVNITVYTLLGEQVQVLENTMKSSGRYRTIFSAREYGLSAGVYLAKVKIGPTEYMIRMVETK